jgi:hypothetical protein
VRALLIPVFGPVEEVEQNGLDDLRRVVEGHIEALRMPGREDANAYVNEAGLLAGLPRNARATLLLGFRIAAPAVPCGFGTTTGQHTAIPEGLAQTVHAASTWTDPSRD